MAGAEGCRAPIFDFAAARTSVSVTRPSGPVPFTLARSTPSSAPIRRATGDAFTRASWGCGGGRVGCVGAGDTPASTAFSFFSFFGSPFFSGFFFSSSFLGSFSFALTSSGFSSSFSSSTSGFSSFPFSSSLGASSPSPPMNAILSPTFTLPPSST